jgi:hypothetical protein
MTRAVLAVMAAVGLTAGPARAETLPLVEGMPSTYTPGQPFSFTLRVPELLGLTAYNLQLKFGTEVTNPPLLVFATPAGPDRYVFGTTERLGFGLETDPNGTEVRFSLIDPLDNLPPREPGVDVVAGANDTLGTITVSPGVGLTGPITISIGNTTNFNYLSESGPIDPPGPFVVQQADTGSPPVGGNPVPAPPAALLFGIGAVALAARAKLTRRSA